MSGIGAFKARFYTSRATWINLIAADLSLVALFAAALGRAVLAIIANERGLSSGDVHDQKLTALYAAISFRMQLSCISDLTMQSYYVKFNFSGRSKARSSMRYFTQVSVSFRP